ncbi:beta-ketoacyl-[acyl-carrier-protein] synthase family protein [Myxococcota bacterium]|nr:beta-ketoacyl-[acyl-carrier-protein] synthase family protein [Myxococcota bacterium]
MHRRVVITGVGAVSPFGASVSGLFDNLVAGRSAVSRIRSFDASTLPSGIGAEVPLDDVEVPDSVGPFRVTHRQLRFILRSAIDALEASGLPRGGDPRRRAVCVATGTGSSALDAFGPQALETVGLDQDPWTADLRPFFARVGGAGLSLAGEDFWLDTAAPAIALLAGAEQVFNVASACASGAHALHEAARMVRRGRADAVVVAAAGSVLSPVMVAGFGILRVLSRRNDAPERASRPFDADRDGFVVGEGTAAAVVEDYESARRRGAPIFAEVLGTGVSADAWRLTDPDPDGRGMALCMERALADAGIDAGQVDYVNAHATSTVQNDVAETRALQRVLGGRAPEVPVSATKSMIGHLVYAAGLVEAIVCGLTLERGVIHPTINLDRPDPACTLDYVPHVAREARVRIALSNSFGLGGQNVSLVLGRAR